MFWISLAVLLRITSNSLLNVGQKKLSLAYSPFFTNFNTYFILFLVCVPLFLLVYLKSFTFEMFVWSFVGGFFGALGNVFLISALRYGELSVLGPVNSYKPIVALMVGIFLIGEIPGLVSLFGMLVVIAGSYIVFDTVKEGFSPALLKRKDIQFRIFALVFSAIEAVFIKKIILLSDIYCSFLLWVIFGCIFSFFILKASKTKKARICNLKMFLPLSLCVFIMQFSTNFVFSKISVGAALSLFQLSNILNVFLGYKIFNEKHLLKKLIGSIIMVIGAIMIICYN